MASDTVCNGCWQKGRCVRPGYCKCSCTNAKAPWNHVDDPSIKQVFTLDENLEY